MKKCSLNCPICTQGFQRRVSRHWFLKRMLFFLPIKIYYCNFCEKNVYILLQENHLFNEPVADAMNGKYKLK